MASRAFESKMTRRRRAPWVFALQPLPILVFIAWLATHPQSIAVASAVMIAVLTQIATLTLFFANSWPKRTRLQLEATPDHLRILPSAKSKERIIARSSIRAGYVIPATRTYPLTLRIVRKGALVPLNFETNSEDHARGILRALGLDASQTVATFWTQSRLNEKPTYAIPFVLILMALGMLGFFKLFVLAFVALIVMTLVPSRVAIGTDGIAVRWFGHTRYFPRSQIIDVSAYRVGGRRQREGIALTIEPGKTVRIPVEDVRRRDGSGEKLAMMMERIREAMDLDTSTAAETRARANHRQASTDIVSRIRRDGRDVREWIRALRTLGAEADASHRVAAIPREALWQLVDDAASPAASRAAAAVALGTDDPVARIRIADAARATAEPRLRVALESVARGATDDDEIASAMDDLTADERARFAR
jgi:hypothetical protein